MFICHYYGQCFAQGQCFYMITLETIDVFSGFLRSEESRTQRLGISPYWGQDIYTKAELRLGTGTERQNHMGSKDNLTRGL